MLWGMITMPCGLPNNPYCPEKVEKVALMRSTFVMAMFLASAVQGAVADPKTDAQAIVEATVSEEMMAATFAAMSELVASNLQNEAGKAGKPLSDDAAKAAGDIMVAKMLPYLVEGMRAEMAGAYLYSMSPEALAGFRAFLETPAGVEWANAQAELIRESTKIGKQLAEPVASKAVKDMVEDIKSGKWPVGTLASTKAELQAFFEQ